jgi:hypothetical protein
MGLRDPARQLKKTLAHAAEQVRPTDVVKKIDVDSLREVAIGSSGVTNRRGEVKRWRVAKAAVNPAGTGRKVVKAVGKELLHQRRAQSDAATRRSHETGYVMSIWDDPDVCEIYRMVNGQPLLDFDTLGPIDRALVVDCIETDQEMEALGRPVDATLRALSKGAQTVHNLSDVAAVGWKKLITCNTGSNVEVLAQHGASKECAIFGDWVVATISKNGWGPDGNATQLGRLHSNCMAIAAQNGGGVRPSAMTGRFEAPDGSEALGYEPPT